MPSEARPTRERARGRTRSRSRPVRGARPRLAAGEAESIDETPATGSHPGGSKRGREIVMAATPQPGWQASLRGSRHSLMNMWTYKRIGFFMLFLWVLLLFSYGLSSDSLYSEEYILWRNAAAKSQSQEKTTIWELLFNFFFPTTCIVKENQKIQACNKLQELNETECLRFKCCFSSFNTGNLRCFVPLKDKPTQMLRMFGLGIISMITLGCLPIYCCSLCRRSKWANPLRRKVNRILMGLKKERNKLKADAEMLGTSKEDVEGDEKEQETKALVSY